MIFFFSSFQMKLEKLNPPSAEKLKFCVLLFHFKATFNLCCEVLFSNHFCF